MKLSVWDGGSSGQGITLIEVMWRIGTGAPHSVSGLQAASISAR